MEYIWLAILAVYLASVLLQGLHARYTFRAWTRGYFGNVRMPHLARCHWAYVSACFGRERASSAPTQELAAQSLLMAICPLLNTCFVLCTGVLLVFVALPEWVIEHTFGSMDEFDRWCNQPWRGKFSR